MSPDFHITADDPQNSFDIISANIELKDLEPADVIRYAATVLFKDRLCVVSSFGAESVILLHMVSKVQPTIPIIFLNTGKLFGETLRYRDRLQESLGLMDIRSIAPSSDDLNAHDEKGNLWTKDMDQCCHIRKVLPQERATAPFQALITGRKRFQTKQRSQMDMLELHNDGKYRLNPLANWGLDQLRDYIESYNLPRHPLVKDGYLSIGCMPCTARASSDADYRSGRWAGTDKDECGIHTNIDGDGI